MSFSPSERQGIFTPDRSFLDEVLDVFGGGVVEEFEQLSLEKVSVLSPSVSPFSTVRPDTPLCNTGCQSAQGEEKQREGVVVDWLNFTYPIPQTQTETLLNHLKKILGDDWVVMEKPFYGYGAGVRCGSIVILWNGHREDMGVHVQISGQGCRELEGRGLTDWRAWFADRLKEGADFSRSDMALDDKEGRLSIDWMVEKFRAGCVVSRFNTFEPVAKYDGEGTLTAHGFNIGRRDQDTSICVYDKALEAAQRHSKEEKAAKKRGEVLSLDRQQALEQQWTRVELRNRNDRAQVLIQRITHEGFSIVAGVLRGYLEFKEPGENAQRCRWAIAARWAAFLDWAEKTRLKLDGRVSTIQTAVAWVDRQVAVVLAMAKAVMPNYREWLEDVELRGSERFGIRHINMMSAYGLARDAAIGHLAPP